MIKGILDNQWGFVIIVLVFALAVSALIYQFVLSASM
jgi:hypothetical protein